MRRIRVLFLGGTISMTEAVAGLRPDLAGADLVRGLGVEDDVALEPVDVARVDSSALTFDTCLQALDLADRAVLAGEADGVVVVQGTDTIEETAYLWDLLWSHPTPFVVTGAMRSPGSPGSDGAANLSAAVALAAAPDAAGTGVLVVLGDEIHAARHVTKRHASSPAAFASPDLGPLGWMHEGRPVLAARVPRRETLSVPRSRAKVALLRCALEDDPGIYRAVADLSEALVIDGFGAGQVRPEVAQVLHEVAVRKPVVLASRTGAGSVATSTYGGLGSGTDLVSRAVVSAGRLNALKARILLSLLMAGAEPASRQTVTRAFTHHGS